MDIVSTCISIYFFFQICMGVEKKIFQDLLRFII